MSSTSAAASRARSSPSRLSTRCLASSLALSADRAYSVAVSTALEAESCATRASAVSVSEKPSRTSSSAESAWRFFSYSPSKCVARSNTFCGSSGNLSRASALSRF